MYAILVSESIQCIVSVLHFDDLTFPKEVNVSESNWPVAIVKFCVQLCL